MKAHEFRDELFESLMYDADLKTKRQLTEMRNSFVQPYQAWLNQRLDERRLAEAHPIDPATLQGMMSDFAAMKPAGLPKAASLGDIVPEKLQHQFYDKIPDAKQSTPVKGFGAKIKTALAAVKDAAAKKELLKLAQTAVKNPDLQSLALTAISGAAGAAVLMTTASPQAAGAVAGGLASIARAKMSGQDWKSAAKAGAKGAAMGLAAGAIGGLAATAVGQLGHMMMANTSTHAPIADPQHHKDMEGMLGDLKQMAKDGKITDHASYEKALDMVIKQNQESGLEAEVDRSELDMWAGAAAAEAHGGRLGGGSAAIEKAFVELENPEAAKGFDQDIKTAADFRKEYNKAVPGNAANNQSQSSYKPGVQSSKTVNDINDFEESVAVNYGLRVLLEAGPVTDEDLYLAQKKAGFSDEQIKSVFDKAGVALPAIADKTTKKEPTLTKPAKAQKPAEQPATQQAQPTQTAPEIAKPAPISTSGSATASMAQAMPGYKQTVTQPATTAAAPTAAAAPSPTQPVTQTQAPVIKTGDAQLDREVNDKLSKDGKAAAEAYLREIIWQERQTILSTTSGIRSEIAKLKPAQARQVLDILKTQKITEATRSAHPNIIQQIALAVAKQKPNSRVAILQDLKLIAGIAKGRKPTAPKQSVANQTAPAQLAAPAVKPRVKVPAGRQQS
jgi:hypothetical protein